MQGGKWLVAMLAAILAAPGGWAQPSAPAQASPSAPSTAAQPSQAPPRTQPGIGERRRDPFRPIISVKKQAAQQTPPRLPPGKAGLVIGQLQLQGIILGINGEWIAMVDNKTKRAYFLREGDEVYSGVVTRITPDSIVFEEKYMDALGQTRTREVVKRLAAD